jgi:hypothetical protein
MSHRPRDRVKTISAALHLEKAITYELIRALQAQIELNEFLKERIEELEKR